MIRLIVQIHSTRGVCVEMVLSRLLSTDELRVTQRSSLPSHSTLDTQVAFENQRRRRKGGHTTLLSRQSPILLFFCHTPLHLLQLETSSLVSARCHVWEEPHLCVAVRRDVQKGSSVSVDGGASCSAPLPTAPLCFFFCCFSCCTSGDRYSATGAELFNSIE